MKDVRPKPGLIAFAFSNPVEFGARAGFGRNFCIYIITGVQVNVKSSQAARSIERR